MTVEEQERAALETFARYCDRRGRDPIFTPIEQAGFRDLAEDCRVLAVMIGLEGEPAGEAGAGMSEVEAAAAAVPKRVN